MNSIDLLNMKRIVKSFDEMETISRNLISLVPKGRVYVGVCGVKLEFDCINILDDFMVMRNVRTLQMLYMCVDQPI